MTDFELPITEPVVPKLSIRSARQPNPFRIRPEELEFEAAALESERAKTERRNYLKQSIVDRAKVLQPKVPLRQYSPRIPKSSPVSARVFNKDQYKRRQRLDEKIAEKRDIYLIQLILNKKGKNLDQLLQQIEDEKEIVDVMENRIIEESHQCQRESDRVELELQKGRKQAESATQARVDIEKALHKRDNNNGLLQSEISKNEENLENYQLYREFLLQVKPDNMTMEEMFKDPDILIKIIDNEERDNLFLQQQLDILEDMESRGNTTAETQLQDLKSHIALLEERINKDVVPALKSYEEAPENQQQQQQQEDEDEEEVPRQPTELEYLSARVMKLFVDCFKKTAALTPVEALERIEAKLEEFYRECELVNPEFIREKQDIIDDARKEAIRKQIILDRERMLLEKKMHALERATRPVKRRVGRKLMERSLPNRQQKKSDELLLLQQMEKARVEKLLYGEDD